MDSTQLFVEERQAQIVEFIDLRDLESAHLILRTHGGAMVKSKTGLELNSSQKEVQNLIVADSCPDGVGRQLAGHGIEIIT